MTKGCPDYINDLNDYLDGAIDKELCAEIEAHIGQCKNCRIMVDSMRQTVTLCREGISEQLPEKLSSRLNDLLRQRWEKKFGKNK